MSDTLDLIEALFPVQDLIRFNGQEVVGADLSEFIGAGSAKTVDALSPDGKVAFVFGVQEDSTPDAWEDCRLKPTAALYKDGTSILIWAFGKSLPKKDVKPLADALGMDGVDEPIPMPGHKGWKLIVDNPNTHYSLDRLMKVYGPQDEAPPWEDDAAVETYGDAAVLAPYDETDPKLGQELILSLGRDSNSKRWKPTKMPIGQLVAMFCQHKEGEKDGPSVVLADMVEGPRAKNAIKAIYAVGLDLDDGVPVAEVDAALKKAGVLAVRYSTHSHMKRRTDILRDALLKWSDKFADGADVSDDLVQRWMAEKGKIDKRIIASAKIVGEDHKATGKIIIVEHLPIPKHRIIIPLKKPFVIGDEGRTQAEAQDKWRRIPQAVGDMLGLPIDQSCLDVTRLFYLPRHPKGGKFDTSLFGGPLLDWATLDIEEDVFEKEAKRLAKTGGRSTTDKGKQLGRWSKKAAHGFQIVQVLEEFAPDQMRHQVSMGWEITCPFDENHSNPGDPEDRACLAVNAGDGPSEIFTLSCRHESCRDKTNLDMLGKMIEDQWFCEDVLEDPDYNIAELEDASDPKAAEKIDREDKARAKWEEAIDTLSPDSSDEDVEEVLRVVLEAKLGDLGMERVPEMLKNKLNQSLTACKKFVAKVTKQVRAEESEEIEIDDPLHRQVFSYRGEFNFDEAFEVCFKTLRGANKEAGKPLFCCVEDQPVRLVEDKKTERVRFGEVNARALWSEMNERVTFVRLTDQGVAGARQQVPTDVANHVYEQAYRKLPQAPEVLYTPVFVDGERNGVELISEPGWYKDLDLLMAPSALKIPALPEEPDAEEVEWAVNLLTVELLGDFPFLDHDLEGNERREPSLANALAMIITPFMRRLINSCTPVFFISKPTPGTGGTLLGTIPIYLFEGKLPTPIRYTQSEEEMQKALLAEVMKAESHLFFDDVREFNNRALLQSITAHFIGGRILGQSKTAERPNRFNWIGTGNNTLIYDEMGRRIVDIRLNAKTANIQKRDFRHKNYNEWLSDNRIDIVYAILLLIQNWISYGSKPFTKRKRASFEDWSRKVGGVLQSAGIEGFLDNARRAGTDTEEAAIRVFVREWLRKWGKETQITPAEMFNYALDADLAICDGNNDDQKKSRFMKRLPSLEGRTFTIGDDNYMVLVGQNADEDITFSLTPLIVDET